MTASVLRARDGAGNVVEANRGGDRSSPSDQNIKRGPVMYPVGLRRTSSYRCWLPFGHDTHTRQ